MMKGTHRCHNQRRFSPARVSILDTHDLIAIILRIIFVRIRNIFSRGTRVPHELPDFGAISQRS
jgi:hypothetical protein